MKTSSDIVAERARLNGGKVMLDKLSAADAQSVIFSYVSSLALSALAVVAPLKEMICALLFLIAVDTVTGIAAVLIKRKAFTSRKFSRAIAKVFVYLTTVCVVHVANKYLLATGGLELPLDTLIVSFIAFTELISIFENLKKISNQPFLQFLIDRLAADRSGIEEELKEEKESKRGTTNRQK